MQQSMPLNGSTAKENGAKNSTPHSNTRNTLAQPRRAEGLNGPLQPPGTNGLMSWMRRIVLPLAMRNWRKIFLEMMGRRTWGSILISMFPSDSSSHDSFACIYTLFIPHSSLDGWRGVVGLDGD